MYVDTDNAKSAVDFSNSIVWLIVPSMTLFITYQISVSDKHLRAQETTEQLVCRLLLEKKQRESDHHCTSTDIRTQESN